MSTNLSDRLRNYYCRNLSSCHFEEPPVCKEAADAIDDLVSAGKEMITYIEDYAASADEDDPAHELLPRYRAAIAKAEGKS
jgi:hypothetical protein